MSKVAILGLGGRGRFWLDSALKAGWEVSGFDPDPAAMAASRRSEWQREHTISGTVKGADWVVCCLPERLELMQKVIQRAQAEAPHSTVIAVHTAFDVEEVQTCAIRPDQLVQVAHGADEGFALSVTARNTPEIKGAAQETLAQFAAVLSLEHNGQHMLAEQSGAETA